MPRPARCCSGASTRQLGGQFRLFVSAGAFLPPALQQAWEDIGRHRAAGLRRDRDRHRVVHDARGPRPRDGRPAARRASRCGWPTDGEVQFRGPTLFKGYWHAPEATAAAFTDDGWYRTGDIGHLDAAGRLILSGRSKDIIVLPNGFNVYPEDIENALRIAGIRDSVVLETKPGRIEAIVLVGQRPAPAARRPRPLAAARQRDPAELRPALDAAVKAANATLGPNQRIAGWRLWPEADFPRTHTLKVKRDPIRAWAAVEARRPARAAEVGRPTARPPRADRLVRDRVRRPDGLERGLDGRRRGSGEPPGGQL